MCSGYISVVLKFYVVVSNSSDFSIDESFFCISTVGR